MCSGDFSSALGDDFFGLRELGLEKELGLTSLSVPSRLFHGRAKKDAGRVGEGYVTSIVICGPICFLTLSVMLDPVLVDPKSPCFHFLLQNLLYLSTPTNWTPRSVCSVRFIEANSTNFANPMDHIPLHLLPLPSFQTPRAVLFLSTTLPGLLYLYRTTNRAYCVRKWARMGRSPCQRQLLRPRLLLERKRLLPPMAEVVLRPKSRIVAPPRQKDPLRRRTRRSHHRRRILWQVVLATAFSLPLHLDNHRLS